MIHLILLFVVLLAFLGQRTKIAYPASMAILCFFSAIRYMFGSDYSSYMRLYNKLHTPSMHPEYDEYFYTLLNILSPSYFFLIALTSCFFIFTVYVLVTKCVDERYYPLSLFIFVVNPYIYLMNLSAIRQCIAMCLFILAILYCDRKKPWLYALFIGVAFLFHKSAIMLLPFFFVLSPKPFRRRTVLAVLSGLFLLLFVFDLSAVASAVALWFNDVNYIYYVADGDTNSLRATLLTSLYFFYVLGNLNKLEGKVLVCGKLYLIATILGVLAFRLSLFTRIQMYFDIFSIVALPMIFLSVQKRGRVKISTSNPLGTVWGCINKYLLPPLLLVVYFLRYYSFFTNPMWEAFTTYQTIFAA